MKSNLMFSLILIFMAGCCPAPKNEPVLARVNNYEITLSEFEEEFKESPYAINNIIETKLDFLNNLINRKLILQDAQAKGMDKDKDFLKMIEKFWEQSLLKTALDKKANEVSGNVMVSDKEIEEAYAKLPEEAKADKPYDQMYQQIKWEITRGKQTKELNDWVASLRGKADIKISEGLFEE
ncbi:MAG: hypothetical protein PHE18_04700 [Candidatus Omnitrophica bacterium]|nr:hypothetical protein [Candidatus Omnitrophota bacterium]MDD5553159.1 hypothetical protein [Candidatus Omnitrophota bacterium]